MAYLDLDELPRLFDGCALWSARGPAAAWFRRTDHMGDPRVPLKDAVRELVEKHTGIRPDGPVRLLTHLRYFGHCFNPVSFYYCFDETGAHVQATVAEVTNTPWGERHCYVMSVPHTADHGTARLMCGRFQKQLHVSPLMGMDHVYDWRQSEPGAQLLVHIDSHRGDGAKVFDATLSLHRHEIDAESLRRALLRYPLLTLRIQTRIYAHALRLRLRGAEWFTRPHRSARAA
jgi:uncharacterized protein